MTSTTVLAGTKLSIFNRRSLALALFLLLTVPLMAQEKSPVDATGTEVATEETPAAAANADELRREAQNPVASLIQASPFLDPIFLLGLFVFLVFCAASKSCHVI